MRTTLTLFSVLAAVALSAQVPNGSFESWTNMGGYSDPTGWQTSNNNASNVVNVTQVSNAHSGSSAMRMDVWTVQSINIASVAVCPATGNYFPVNLGQPTAITGWYISNFAGGDKLFVTGTMQQGGNTVAGGALTITNSTNVYQMFSVPLIYSPSSAVPDSAAIVISQQSASGNTTGLSSGTYVIVDDISFGVTPGFSEMNPENAIQKIYPNPSNGTSWVEYTLNNAADVSLGVYDLGGNLVQSLVSQPQQPGRFRVAVETAALSQGLYLVKLQTGDSCSCMKLNVVN